MKNSYFFGYGSLVNTSTHSFKTYETGFVQGWRRYWQHTSLRDIPYLSVCPADKTKLYGLIAKVPNNDWKSLDLREKGYNRKSTNCIINSGEVKSTQIYYVPECNFSVRNNNKGLLQSYLDCVIQGYLKQFGEEIATEFFSTTDGWDITIRDDRLNPLYPRHVDLTKSERAFIDHNVKLTKKLMLSQVNKRES